MDHNTSTQLGTGFPQAERWCVFGVNVFGNACSLIVKCLFLNVFLWLVGVVWCGVWVVIVVIFVVHRRCWTPSWRPNAPWF